MSMRRSIHDIYKVFINDEELLRLLYYLPESVADNRPDPLDPSLTNILDMPDEDKWGIIDDRILMTPKTSDLDANPKCRLLFYAGRRSTTNNYLYADQEVICDIYCHFDYEKDQRTYWINDRINDLIVNKNVSGYWKADFKYGGNIDSPDGYMGYKLAYEIINEQY